MTVRFGEQEEVERKMSVESFVPSVIHYREDADVLLYPMVLTLKLLKPRSLLPMIKSRPLMKKKEKSSLWICSEPNHPGNKLGKTRQISGRE